MHFVRACVCVCVCVMACVCVCVCVCVCEGPLVCLLLLIQLISSTIGEWEVCASAIMHVYVPGSTMCLRPSFMPAIHALL